MAVLSQQDAVRLKLHLLSEGVSFDNAFLEHFADKFDSMEKRRAYDDSDERELDRTKRIPQEMYLTDGVVIAVNYKQHSPWQLAYRDSTYRLLGKHDTDIEVTFPQRPRFFEHVTP